MSRPVEVLYFANLARGQLNRGKVLDAVGLKVSSPHDVNCIKRRHLLTLRA